MLTPEQLKSLPDSIVRLFQDLEDYILVDIARRLAKVGDLTDTAKIELEIAKALKTPLSEIEKAIQSATAMANEEIEKLFKANAIKSMDYEDAIYKSAGMDPSKLYEAGLIADIVSSGIRQTQGDLYNFTQSLGFAIMQNGKTVFKPIAAFYQDTLDDALMKVRTGTASYQDAVKQAVKKMSDNGISFVDYKTGHINRLDVASRRAVLTGANQMSLEMTNLLMDELGAEYVEVTAHSGARPDHAEWQGKVYHVGGSIDGYSDFESATGYGTGPGLGGWNCRHNYFPYFPGISERTWTDEELSNIDPPPFEYLGETYTHYESTQVQRVMETDMRKLKREIISYDAAGNKQAFENASIKLQMKKQEYRSFCNAAGLRYQFERGQVYGFTKNISGKSFWKARNALRKPAGNGIIKYPTSQEKIDEIIKTTLKGIRFSGPVIYNPRIRNDAGQAIFLKGLNGENMSLEKIVIGKQLKPGDTELIDTLIHEELEARINVFDTTVKKYIKMQGTSEVKRFERHQHIAKVISRYFRMKGLK